MYPVKVSYAKLWLAIWIVELLFFRSFFYFEDVTFGTRSETIHVFVFFGLISAIGALVVAFMMSALWSSTLTPEGILATFGAGGTENMIRWEEISSITNNWMSPCYVVRDKTTLWPLSVEDFRRRVVTRKSESLRFAALPKHFFLKDKRAFLAHLDRVLPQENILRHYYF